MVDRQGVGMPQQYDEWPDEISWGGPEDELATPGPEDDEVERRRVAIRRGLLALLLAGTAVVALDQGGLLSADGPAANRASRIGQDAPTPGSGDDESGPSKTPEPSEADLPAVAPLPQGLRLLEADRPPEVPYATGSVVHGTAEQFTFPDDWEIHQLEAVADGLLVSAGTPDGSFATVFRRAPDSAAPESLPVSRAGTSDPRVRVVVDPTGSQVAWTWSQGLRRHWLSVTRVGEREPYARVRLEAPALPQAWVAGVGPMLSYALDPGVAPDVYDIARDRLLPVVDESAYRGTFQPTFLAYSPRTGRLLLTEFERCEPRKPENLPIQCAASQPGGSSRPSPVLTPLSWWRCWRAVACSCSTPRA
jgi:hypothetical protein